MTELYPSIDLLDGGVVRLRQGDYAARIDYDVDAVATAVGFAEQGAAWVHVVDLDAVRFGTAVNRDVIVAIAAALDGTAAVQAGGGVRTMADVEALAAAGITRVVLGSAAVRTPELVRQASHVMPVAVGLDHRDGEVAIHGWTEEAELSVLEALGRYPDAAAFVVTDIASDGTLEGPDLVGLAEVVHAAPAPVIASGGVGSLEDLRAVAVLGDLGGIVVGRALYEGRFTVAEALATLEQPT